MTHLTITQGSTAENVSTEFIKKLYDMAMSIPIPQQGETDNIQVSGHISVGYTYKNYAEYLAGTIMYRGTGSAGNNPQGRLQNLQIDVTAGYYIDFEDPEAESICNTNYGTGGTGVTSEQLSQVTRVREFCKNNTNLVKFNEFQYFTGLISEDINSFTTGHAFQGCTNLTEITLPSNLKSIGWGMFSGCTNLQSITIPSSVKNVYMDSFNMSGVKSLTFTSLQGVCYLGEPRQLEQLTINEGTTLLNMDHTKVQELSIPNSLKNLNLGYSNNLLTKITFDPSCSNITLGNLSCGNLTTLENYYDGLFTFSGTQTCAFYGSQIAIDLTVPEGITRVADVGFGNCSEMLSVTLPTTIATIPIRAFDNFNTNGKVIIKATTPPTLASGAFDVGGTAGGCNIYVPDTVVNDYQTATNWDRYASRIKPMSTLT